MDEYQSPASTIAVNDDDSPLANLNYNQTEARSGGLFSKDDSSKGEIYSSILKRAGQEFVEIEETSAASLELLKYSMHAYGAQFCEVRINQESGEVKVSCRLGSFDCGRILNPKTAVSQFRGGDCERNFQRDRQAHWRTADCAR